LRGRINLGSQLELNARVSQFDDQLDQNAANYLGQVDYSYSTTQEAELYAKLNLNDQHHILLGTTHSNLDGNVLSYGVAYKGDVSSQGYYTQHRSEERRVGKECR